MKYRLHYFSKYRRPEEGNNKAKLIKYANEFTGRAFVTEIATGKVIYRNAAMRKFVQANKWLDSAVAALKNGTPIDKIIDFSGEA